MPKTPKASPKKTTNKITKTLLIQQLAEKLGISQTESEKFLNTYIQLTTDNLKSGKEITITGFGTYRKSKRAAREGRNPQTGEKIKIGPTTTVRFTAGKTLKDSVA
jgi:DNA-binding protein HU-beta